MIHAPLILIDWGLGGKAMVLLAQADRDTISKMFDGLVDPVRILLFTIPTSPLIVPGRETCESCDDVQALLTEVSELSDKLTLDVRQFARGSEDAQKYDI